MSQIGPGHLIKCAYVVFTVEPIRGRGVVLSETTGTGQKLKGESRLEECKGKKKKDGLEKETRMKAEVYNGGKKGFWGRNIQFLARA
jgi:hypothetical protein